MFNFISRFILIIYLDCSSKFWDQSKSQWLNRLMDLNKTLVPTLWYHKIMFCWLNIIFLWVKTHPYLIFRHLNHITSYNDTSWWSLHACFESKGGEKISWSCENHVMMVVKYLLLLFISLSDVTVQTISVQRKESIRYRNL